MLPPLVTATTVVTDILQSSLRQILDGETQNETTNLRQQIKKLAHNTCSFPGNDLDQFELDNYADTPVLQSLQDCPRTPGVYLRWLCPSVQGETMGCYAFLKMHPHSRVMAFLLPTGNSMTFVDNMLDQLRIDEGTGLVNTLVGKLHDNKAINLPI